MELEECRNLILGRYIAPAGRTLFLGGTELSRRRESCMFNCSFTQVETVYDVVDVLWLLLQGCGVGFEPITGTLNGFRRPLEDIQVIRSQRTEKGGNEKNVETWDEETKTWMIQVGDSAIAWAKAVGKLIAGKFPARQLVLDFSQIRPAGERLKGYGWISSGDEQIARAFKSIAEIMSNRADQLLTRMDILDIVNWLGTILSSRRLASFRFCISKQKRKKEKMSHLDDEFYVDGKYDLSGEGKVFTSNEFSEFLNELTKEYPIVSIEDGLDESDWDGWAYQTQLMGDKVTLSD